jgi:hypothetical protein
LAAGLLAAGLLTASDKPFAGQGENRGNGAFLDTRDPRELRLTFNAPPPEGLPDEMAALAGQGIRCRVIYDVRIFEEAGGRFVLLRQMEINQDGGWDPFLQTFQIKRSGGGVFYYAGEDEFIAGLFGLQDFPLASPEAEDWKPGHYQIRIRTKPEKMILRPPFTVLSFSSLFRWLSQGWYIYDFVLGGPE